MKVRLFIGFLILVFQTLAGATWFVPLPIEEQVREASSAAEVSLLESKSYKSTHGLIMTDYIFEVITAYNLSPSVLDEGRLKLTFPGGTFEGMTSMIDGAPVFNKAEKSFLLLKNIDSKIYLSNFTLGKYKIIYENGVQYYISNVFPDDPKIGKILKEKMLELLKTKWKIVENKKNNTAFPSRYLASSSVNKFQMTKMPRQNLKRVPAEKVVKAEHPTLYFLVALFLLTLCFVFIFSRFKK